MEAVGESFSEAVKKLREEWCQRPRSGRVPPKVTFRLLRHLYRDTRGMQSQKARRRLAKYAKRKFRHKRSQANAFLVIAYAITKDRKLASRWGRACAYAAAKGWSPMRFELELFRCGGVEGLAGEHAKSNNQRGKKKQP